MAASKGDQELHIRSRSSPRPRESVAEQRRRIHRSRSQRIHRSLSGEEEEEDHTKALMSQGAIID